MAWTRNINEVEITDRLAEMLKQSRIDQEITRKQLAKRLHKSDKTLQNWEEGYSSPDIVDLLRWFHCLGLNPLRYILDFCFPEVYKDTDLNGDIDKIKDTLLEYIKDTASKDEIRKLSYCIFGNTGSSWNAQLDMITAHNHLPLIARIGSAKNIHDMYQMCESLGLLVGTEYIKPNLVSLSNAYEYAKESVMNGKNGYSLAKISDVDE